jgi:predicted ribosome quality control (RQC) complex YloA/Tae2 family protein
MASKGRPYRTLAVGGFEVLVGRGDAENDALTFEVADPHDVWLHVAGGTPGSHVVIRNPKRGEVPRPVIEGAASLAAWYSKARNAAKVEVHFCRVADVSKPRGAPTGLVELSRYKSVRVKPQKPEGDAGA